MTRWTTLFAIALGAAACAAESESTLPEAYLGRWYYAGSSGGIAGDGLGDEPTGYLVIHADGTIDSFREDGTRVGTVAYEAGQAETIFSTETQWVLRTEGLDQAIQLFDDGRQMSLSENVYDGFSRAYVRSR